MKYLVPLLILLLIPIASANFGVSSIYSKRSPLSLNPGDTKQTFLIIQNPTEEEMTISATMLSGSEIARITDISQKYTIKPSERAKVNIEIQIPQQDFKSNYSIGVLFKPEETEKSGGIVQFVTNIGISFPVIVQGGVTEEATVPPEDIESKVSQSIQMSGEETQKPKGTFQISKIQKSILIILILATLIVAVSVIIVIWTLKENRKSNIIQRPINNP